MWNALRTFATALVLTAALLVTGCRCTQTAPAPGGFRPVAQGIYELGRVRVDSVQRTVSFPAVVNLVEVPLEYMVVHMNGKAHESLLVTDAQPQHIHVAMLLLGATGAGTNLWTDPTQPPPGDRVTVDISWRRGFRRHRRPAAELVLDQTSATLMSPGPWTYNGSRFTEDAFSAQRDGSIVSLITDPDALMNNPRPGRDNDDNWRANRRLLPPMGERVRVTVTVEASAATDQ